MRFSELSPHQPRHVPVRVIVSVFYLGEVLSDLVTSSLNQSFIVTKNVAQKRLKSTVNKLKQKNSYEEYSIQRECEMENVIEKVPISDDCLSYACPQAEQGLPWHPL